MKSREIRDRTIVHREARGSRTISDLSLENCTFDDCFLESANPAKRMRVQSLRLRDCRAINLCDLKGIVLDDVIVDGLETRRGVWTWAVAFRHVTLRGQLGKIYISNYFPQHTDNNAKEEKVQAAFDRANREFHEKVDWALDISEAEFYEFEIRSILPANRIRRDPETQFVVTRPNAIAGDWKRIVPSESAIEVGLCDLADSADDSAVFVACKRSRHFKRELAILQALRRAGIAEPN